MTFPELAIRRPVTTLMTLVSLAVLGTVAVFRLPLAFMPEAEEPELFVRLPYPNASPDQIETMILRPVEEVLGSVRGLDRMWARIDESGATARLEFDWSTNLHLARVEVWEKLDRIRRELPDDLENITVGTSWNNRETDDPILEGRLSSDRDLSESYDLLDRRIVRPLLRVPGVAQVKLDGVSPKEVRINLRIEDLELHGIDIRDVADVLRRSNFDQSLGEVRSTERVFRLRTLGAFKDVDEIRNLRIRSDGLRLRNVAEVVYKEPELDFGRHLDGNFAIGVTVSAESSANVVEVCDRLEKRIAAMIEDPELEGLKFLVWESQGKEIKRTLGELFTTGVFGAVLAAIVLFVFLRRFSTTTISVICIPFSLIVASGVIWAMGRTMNTLTLLGLIVGIGMLVDNAVVVIENIFRHQELGCDRKTAALKGSREVSTAVIAATLTSVIVFLPMIFNKPSEMNIRLREIGSTVCLTLLASLFVSQTLIPLATSWFIRAKKRPRERWLVWLEEKYERVLAFNLRHRFVTPIVGLLIAASAVYPFLKVDMNFDSARSSSYAQIHYEFTEETPLDKKEEVISQVEKLIDPHRDELRAKSTYSWWSYGYTMTREYLRDGELNQENLAAARQKLRTILPEIPGIRVRVSEGRRSWRKNSGKRVAFQIFGEEYSVIRELAEEARLRIARIDGLVESFGAESSGRQELHVEVDRDLVARFDVPATGVAQTVGLTYRGQRLQRFRTPSGEREMRLTLDEKKTESVSQLRNLPVRTRAGEKVPLASIASFTDVEGPERVERDDRQTSVWVGARYTKGKREDYIPLVKEALADMEFPYGYSWTFGDWQSRSQRRTREFLENLFLALLLVFAVMSGLFESVSQAVALMIALPFALTGAIWTLWLAGTDFDQQAAVGVLLLIGIVVNNGIVMLEHINAYRAEGMDRTKAMIRGGRERLRPILMTAVTTLIGLLPIVIQRPSLGGNYYHSMALVIMGGIAVSTLLTTLLLPTTTSLVEDGVAWVGSLFRRSRKASESDA
ncbi:MAG: efflux RND transporter permease subunit [Planctomycetota bacterium]